jgi:hypothetical protein
VKIRLLTAARRDLLDGFRFYEKQAEGIGRYFLDSLYSDIDSLLINTGVHPLHFGKYHSCYPSAFPSRSTTAWRMTPSWCMRCWTAGAIRPGSETG